MEIKILSQEHGMVELGVTVPGSALTEALNKVYEKHQNDPGFALPREGLDENPESKTLLQEAVQELFSGIYQDVMRQVDLPVASEPKVAVVGASEKEGVSFTLSFALRPKMKLGKYKGIRVKMPNIVPTEAEYQAAQQAAEARNQVPTDVERPAVLGDITVIDFTGYQDGTAFAGGAGTDYALTLGSGQFIPGFEDQLVGASAGDHVEVHVTFPEQYHVSDLAGKPAVFQVAVKKVQEKKLQPLNEQQKQQIRQQVAQQKKDQADQEIEDQVLGIVLKEAQVELPEAMIESEANICAQQFAAELAAKGMTIDQFCQQNGKTLDGIRREMYPLARRRIQLRLVLSAIAEAEHIVAEEAEVESCWDQMAQQYGIPKEQLRQYAGPETDAEIRADLVSRKAYMFLRESTILERE